VLVAAVTAGHAAVVELLLRYASPAVIDFKTADWQTALYFAVISGQQGMVDMLLDAGADANAGEFKDGSSPLMVCADVAIATKLIAKGALVNLPNGRGENALMTACQRGNTEVTVLLLGYRADLTAVNREGSTALVIACQSGHYGLVPLLLLRARGGPTAWLNIENNDGYTALLHAVESDNARAVQSLVEAGADVNQRPSVGLGSAHRGRTPLRLATDGRNLDIARILLRGGAKDTLVGDGWRDTALIRACDRGDLPLVELLLEFKSDINAQANSSSPLISAARSGKLDMIRVLLAADPPALVNGRSLDGDTALMSASWDTGTPVLVRALLDAGADPMLANSDGMTALMHTRNPTCVKLLVEAGPGAVNMVNKRGETALWGWSRCPRNDKKMIKVVKQLFASSEQCGVVVEVNHRNVRGDSALDEALAAMNSEVVSLLMTHGALLDNMAIIKPLEYIRRIKSSDANINACLRIVLQHALDTGCFEQPVVDDEDEDDDQTEAEEDDDGTEEEVPAPKRRRRQ
jgi:ankyrin repeat protein